jgi:vacuolar-type H+-ATPase subunit I/STV1
MDSQYIATASAFGLALSALAFFLKREMGHLDSKLSGIYKRLESISEKLGLVPTREEFTQAVQRLHSRIDDQQKEINDLNVQVAKMKARREGE